MPVFNIYCSIPKSALPEDFLKEASAFLAGQLKKPESYVNVRVCPDQLMSFGGSTDPCGCVEVHSLGAIGPQVNNGHACEIAKFISTKLNIPNDRFYVIFDDMKRSDCGLGGKTFG